jgi:GH15 family glucan-1,4-alpha-glucosidase
VDVPLTADPTARPLFPAAPAAAWDDVLAGSCRVQLPDDRIQHLFDAAMRTLVLHTPGDTYPGPYTYKRFWFRDAALIANGLLCGNLTGLAERVFARFFPRQRLDGYFHSQEGEWDSNGQVLWILQQYRVLTGQPAPPEWQSAVAHAADWLVRKRRQAAGELHDGLLPPGFSAEHLGNNDYYYWDDFWAWAGLLAAAELLQDGDDMARARQYREQATAMGNAIEHSLSASRHIRATDALPASPYRRMDAGAIGSLAASYPLHLLPPEDPRVLATVDYLQQASWVQGAFFQNMVHSGLNAYLTLHVAQVLLRAGRPEFQEAVQAVVDLASPTGQWPEAIHPRTHGGCMGDGQHVWAAAEFVVMLRNMFVRHEDQTLILGSGIFPEWLQPGAVLRFGPAPTPFGPISLEVEAQAEQVTLSWSAEWRKPPAILRTALPQTDARTPEPHDQGSVVLPRRST